MSRADHKRGTAGGPARHTPLTLACIGLAGAVVVWLSWSFVVSPIRDARAGMEHSAPVTWRMGGMAADAMRRALPREIGLAGARTVLRPDDRRRGRHAMSSDGTAVAFRDGREIARCRYSPTWSAWHRVWPDRVSVSDCEVAARR